MLEFIFFSFFLQSQNNICENELDPLDLFALLFLLLDQQI